MAAALSMLYPASVTPDATLTTAVVAPVTDAAWFQSNPTCKTPIGCVAAPAASPYPSGTFHTSITGGSETDRAYLRVEAPRLPASAQVDGAQLVIPLDTSANDGSVSPDTSAVVICSASGNISGEQGSFAAPPETDCSTESSASYVALPTPHLTASLSGMASTIAREGALLAIVPSTSETTAATWHVVFAAGPKGDSALPAATLTLTVETPEAPVLPTQPSPSPESAVGAATVGPRGNQAAAATSSPTSAVRTGTTRAASPAHTFPAAVARQSAPDRQPQPLPSLTRPAVSDPRASDPGATGPQAAAVAPAPIAGPAEPPLSAVSRLSAATSSGYPYPLRWLLPVVILAGLLLVGRVMTADISPGEDRS